MTPPPAYEMTDLGSTATLPGKSTIRSSSAMSRTNSTPGGGGGDEFDVIHVHEDELPASVKTNGKPARPQSAARPGCRTRHPSSRINSRADLRQSTTVVVNQPILRPLQPVIMDGYQPGLPGDVPRPPPPPRQYISSRPAPVAIISGSDPQATVCYNCQQSIVTYLYYESGSCSYVSCIFLAIIGIDCGCCLIPFCLDIFKDVVHKCPQCHIILGRHKRI